MIQIYRPSTGGGADPVESPAVTNRSAVTGFFDSVRTRRGTILLMADSNHNFNSWGWCLGLGLPLMRRYGCWGLHWLGSTAAAAQVVGGSAAGTNTNWLHGGYSAATTSGTDIVTTSDLATGTELFYVWGATACGLTEGVRYYWNRQSSTTGYLYDTLANAISGGATGRVDLTASTDIALRIAHMGDTVDYLLSNGAYVPSFTPSATDQVNNVLTFPGIHRFTAADEVTVSETGGGLTAGTSYYVKLGDESDANTTFELRLYTDVGLTSIVDLTADITAQISPMLSTSSRYNGYLSGATAAPQVLIGNRSSLKGTWFHRTHAAGPVNGSFTPSCRFPSPFAAINASGVTTVTGTDAWTKATLTISNDWTCGALPTATTMTISGHSFSTQDPVVLLLGGTNGTAISQGITYYVRRVDANTIQLHASAANANSNTSALTLTGISGTLRRHWYYTEWFSSQYATIKLKGKAQFGTRWVEDPGMTNGLSMSVVFGVGGATANTMLVAMKGNAAIWPRALVEARDVSSGGPLMVIIQVGGNDRSQSVAVATMKANIQTIMNEWIAHWAAAGGAASDLYFVLLYNHPQQTIAENLNTAYHTAHTELAQENQRTASVNMVAGITTAGEMYLQGATVWYDSGGDAHLTAAGYTELGNRIVSHLCG